MFSYNQSQKLISLIVVFATVFVTGCVNDAYYRTITQDLNANCDDFSLFPDNQEEPFTNDPKFRCALQRHIVSPKNLWKNVANFRRISEPNEFHLAFAEILDDPSDLQTNQQQIAVLKNHLQKKNANKQNYVVTYIHGWRHNADEHDTDLKKFRVILAYTRSFLNTRCVTTGKYCNSSLTGLFVGWRGKSIKEPFKNPSDSNSISGNDIIAALSIFGRKDQSEILANNEPFAIEKILSAVDDSIDLASGDHTADKHLIAGHSLGGNILANIMKPKVKNRIKDHSPGNYFSPVFGDLVVLINPASSSNNWKAIQEEVAIRAEVSNKRFWESKNDRLKLRNFFSANQRPIYLSITSTDNWYKEELPGQNGPSNYDTATSNLFPLYQWARLKFKRHQNTTIGHVLPNYEANENKIISDPYGPTHDFIVNSGAGRKTSYLNAGNPKYSWCESVDGWLAREKEKTLFVDEFKWDYGLHNINNIRNVGGRRNKSYVQIRNNLFLKAGFRQGSILGQEAFWNMRTLDRAVQNHNGFQSYPLWCTLSQLVLDDITKN